MAKKLQQPQRGVVQQPIDLHIPEELLVWAETPEVEVTLSRPMAKDVRALLANGELLRADTERLFARLDGLVTAALAAERGDLLLGFDMFTAHWLGLRYSVDTALGRLEVGRNAAWTFDELNLLFTAGREAAIAAWKAKALCADVFPGVRVDEVMPRGERPCATCGRGSFSVMLSTETATYCRRCWTMMTAPPPAKDEMRKSR